MSSTCELERLKRFGDRRKRCNAGDATGCTTMRRHDVGSNPGDLTLDLVNGTAYVRNFYDNYASVFCILSPS